MTQEGATQRGRYPGIAASLDKARNVSARATRDERAAGLAYARTWRIRNKPKFDARYGPESPA